MVRGGRPVRWRRSECVSGPSWRTAPKTRWAEPGRRPRRSSSTWTASAGKWRNSYSPISEAMPLDLEKNMGPGRTIQAIGAVETAGPPLREVAFASAAMPSLDRHGEARQLVVLAEDQEKVRAGRRQRRDQDAVLRVDVPVRD